MPFIPIYLSAEHIIGLHESLIEVYREDNPPTNIEEGFNYKGAIENICFIVATDRYGDEGFSHFLERAAYLFFHLNRSHPFTDGNKRTALLATYYFLMWNGYTLIIPEDAHKLILAIADSTREDITLDHAYNWILDNISKSFISLLLGSLVNLFIVSSILFLRCLTHVSRHDLLANLMYSMRISEIMNDLVDRTGLKKSRYKEDN